MNNYVVEFEIVDGRFAGNRGRWDCLEISALRALRSFLAVHPNVRVLSVHKEESNA